MNASFDPSMMDVRPFIKYKPNGEICSCGTEGLYFVREKIARGDPIIIVDRPYDLFMEAGSFYVDVSGPLPIVSRRPVWTPSPDTVEPMPRQEIVIPNAPACKVIFTGPRSGTQDHDGKKPLKIGWTIPGKDILTFKAWPMQDVVLQVEVKLPVSASVTL